MNESLLSADQTDVDPNKNYYEDLVGEGRKYRDNEALAKKAVYADQHIAKVEKENAELQQAYLRIMEENNTKAKLEQLIDQYDKRQQQMSITPPEEKTVEQPKYDPAEIESLVSRKLQEHEMSRKQQDNYNQVKGRLIERFGSNYQNVVKQQIEDLGLTETLFNDMARNNPKLVFKTLDLDQPVRRDVQVPVRNSSVFQPQVPDKKRTWSYYKPLFKKNPTDRNLLIQMDKDSQEQGDAFFDSE